jgi:hypothetical protein
MKPPRDLFGVIFRILPDGLIFVEELPGKRKMQPACLG